jgi:hypothetical protein
MKKTLCIAALFVSVNVIGQSNSKLIPYAQEFNYDSNKKLNFVQFKPTHQVSQEEVTDFLNMMLFSKPSVKVSLMKEEVDFIVRLGYPMYFITILGIWKILGVVALLTQAFSFPCLERYFRILPPVIP